MPANLDCMLFQLLINMIFFYCSAAVSCFADKHQVDTPNVACFCLYLGPKRPIFTKAATVKVLQPGSCHEKIQSLFTAVEL